MRRLADQEGAVAIIVAIALIVLFGMGALVVDIGALYFERRQLQNGADGAVLAVAQDCASGNSIAACDAGPDGDRYVTAGRFADANANDGASAVAADSTGVQIDYAAGRATVTTTTLNDGDGVVRSVLARVMPGYAGDRSVTARSTAIWGPPSPGSFPTLPLTFSQCEYDLFLAAGAGTAEEPWTTANNGAPQKIYLQGGNPHQPVPECASATAGKDIPGGFGWLKDVTGSSVKTACEAEFVGATGEASPGASSPCDKKWLEDNVLNKVVFLPVYSDVTADGKKYTFASYAAFYVTGYSLPGANAPGAKGPCDNPLPSCIAGWFTTGSVGGGAVDPSAPNYGVNTVQLQLN